MKKLLLIALAAISTMAYGQNKTFTVNGTVVDADVTKIYLKDFMTSKTIDSCEVADGKFTFKGEADNSKLLMLAYGRVVGNFIAEAGGINVNVDKGFKFSGTPLTDKIGAFQKEMSDINAEQSQFFGKLRPEYEAAKDDKTKDSINTVAMDYSKVMNEKREGVFSKYLEENKSNAVSAFVAVNYVRTKSMEMSIAEIDALAEKYGKNILDNASVASIRGMRVHAEKTSAGNMFVDFPGLSPDGKEIKFSDFIGKGKYVLVDFWASWCGPCTAELPNLKANYEKYSPKGLVILGANVWDKKDGFLKALETHNMPWTHICNFDNNKPTDLYGINGIPQIILFGPDGKIVARDLRGEAIGKKFAEIFGE